MCTWWRATKSQRAQVNVRIQPLRQELSKPAGKGHPPNGGLPGARAPVEVGSGERQAASGERRTASGEHTTEKGGLGRFLRPCERNRYGIVPSFFSSGNILRGISTVTDTGFSQNYLWALERHEVLHLGVQCGHRRIPKVVPPTEPFAVPAPGAHAEVKGIRDPCVARFTSDSCMALLLQLGAKGARLAVAHSSVLVRALAWGGAPKCGGHRTCEGTCAGLQRRWTGVRVFQV